MYEIRQCKTEEINTLSTFLDNSWRKNHIFVKNKNLLNFQHKSDQKYNFVVAYHIETKSFHGVLGFISPNFYVDRKVGRNQDLWLAIWKVDKNLAKVSSLGMDMLNYVQKEFEPKSISAIGINKTVAFFYKAMGFKTKTMNQWFLPNRDIAKPKLIVGNLPNSKRDIKVSSLLTLEYGIEHEKELKHFLLRNKIKKTHRYIVERYLKHPVYKYFIYIIVKANFSIKAVLIGRKVSTTGSNAFRLTELFYESDKLLNINKSLIEIMAQKKYEYIDFLEYGFDNKVLLESGFIQCSDSLFVPHFFEPFEAERKEVKIAFRSKEPFSCTKGDSDLDRPNI